MNSCRTLSFKTVDLGIIVCEKVSSDCHAPSGCFSFFHWSNVWRYGNKWHFFRHLLRYYNGLQTSSLTNVCTKDKWGTKI